MGEQLTPLEQVQKAAKELTLKRIAEEKERRAWQESKEGHISLDDQPEPVAVEEPKVEEPKAKKAVTKRKAK